jgi:hypothetical protein
MFLYKNVLFYFQKNNYVDYDLAAGLVERRHSDSLRATSGEVEAWLRGVHAPGVRGLYPGKVGDVRLNPGARSHVGTSSLICTWSQT